MPRPGYDSVVLLTGLPSVYARKMLEHLLAAEPRALVYAVVNAKGAAQAAAEVEALEGRARVVLLEGDVAAMDLGLSGAELRQLAREVDRIHHMAHTSAVGADRKAARLRWLRDRWAKRLLAASPRVKVLTPLNATDAGGIGLVHVEGVDTEKLQVHLWDKHKILTTPIVHAEYEGARITPNVYTTLEEIDTFAAAMEEIVRKGTD